MPGSELRHASSDRRGMALNSILGVAAESISAAAEVMLLPSLILAFFVAELTPSYATIGLVPAIAIGFWTLGRLPAHLLSPIAPAAATVGLRFGGGSRGSDRDPRRCHQPHGPGGRFLSRRDRSSSPFFFASSPSPWREDSGVSPAALFSNPPSPAKPGEPLSEGAPRGAHCCPSSRPSSLLDCLAPARSPSLAATDGYFSWPRSVWSSSPS